MNLVEKAQNVINMQAEGLRMMALRVDNSFGVAIRVLQNCLENNGKIVIVGIGKSGNVGHKIAATMNSTGATAVVLNSQNALHGDLGLLSDGDVILALSYSGETQELMELMPFLRSFKVKIVALCGKLGSSLSNEADITLDTSVSREACPLNLAPTTSSTAMLVMGDALAMVLLETRGFSPDDFARYHPGGSLGRVLLLKVRDVMRREDKMPTIPVGSRVFDAVSEMNRSHSGACLIIGENGKLAGIFTHGDFARSYQMNPDLGQTLVETLMTRKPITLKEDSLAVEAVTQVVEHGIDDIVVVNEKDEPVGLIDAQDLARYKLI
ncbi:SIS domain-containing protein [Luteolibacter sp. AS25]|uniref:KpsF/GutQ family sugar-phosphate isomerase n=1 Tax=Luteolibacter sp. AS25 TaxID=3135776 RepID=UPI00398A627D